MAFLWDKNALLKTNKMFRLGAELVLGGMFGFSVFGLCAAISSFNPVSKNEQKYNDFIEEVRETDDYQIYYQDEKEYFDNQLSSKEITIEDYNIAIQDLTDNAVYKYLSEQGTEGQLSQKEQLEGKIKTEKNIKLGLCVSAASIIIPVLTTGAVLTLIGKYKKSDLEIAGIKMMDEFGEDEDSLPNIEEDEIEE